MLSSAQLKFLADVCVAISQVSLASLVIPYFISGLGYPLLILGIVSTIALLGTGLFFTKGIK